VLRANADGSTVRLRDVARMEVGGMGYQFAGRRSREFIAGKVCAGGGLHPVLDTRKPPAIRIEASGDLAKVATSTDSKGPQ
jgi:hypothetical protein